jgi:hypothetical protein
MGTKRRTGQDRLTDSISYRISSAQRAFLEEISENNKIGLCEAARNILDEAMAKAGAI